MQSRILLDTMFDLPSLEGVGEVVAEQVDWLERRGASWLFWLNANH
jgi:hypothetical protein